MQIVPFTPDGNVLVVGALGQIGQELTEALRERYGQDRVWAADLRLPSHDDPRFLPLDITDAAALEAIVDAHQIGTLYHLAAILSARGEQDPAAAWEINMRGLFNALELGRSGKLRRIFWPSSIAVFGPSTPRDRSPQHTVTEPSTVYGISKLAGERWCEYYHQRYGVDVRSLRYPGLIGYKSLPGGGTTDYAVEIFHEAVQNRWYTCFLAPDTALPMMYMPDALRATLELMEAPAERIRIRSSYNLDGISFTPQELASEIFQFLPDFRWAFEPDFRQQIADSWPRSIDGSAAREDWGWQPRFTLRGMTEDMLRQLAKRYLVPIFG